MDRFQPQPYRDVGMTMHRCPECTLTDLRIRGTAMTAGWSVPTTEPRGVVEVLWLSCIPWELAPTGHLSSYALKRLIASFPKMFSWAGDPSRVARHLAKTARAAGSGAVWPELPPAYCHR